MKFKHFLDVMLDILKNRTDIQLKTFKIILYEFYHKLSDKEQEKYNQYYLDLMNFRNIQKTIDELLFQSRMGKIKIEYKKLKEIN